MATADRPITMGDLDEQIEALKDEERALKLKAREAEKRVREEVRPQIYALVKMKKRLNGTGAL